MSFPMSMFGPPRTHPRPEQQRGDTWDTLLARYYATDDHGIYCVACGTYIKDGWQADHYDEIHGFKGF